MVTVVQLVCMVFKHTVRAGVGGRLGQKLSFIVERICRGYVM